MFYIFCGIAINDVKFDDPKVQAVHNSLVEAVKMSLEKDSKPIIVKKAYDMCKKNVKIPVKMQWYFRRA